MTKILGGVAEAEVGLKLTPEVEEFIIDTLNRWITGKGRKEDEYAQIEEIDGDDKPLESNESCMDTIVDSEEEDSGNATTDGDENDSDGNKIPWTLEEMSVMQAAKPFTRTPR